MSKKKVIIIALALLIPIMIITGAVFMIRSASSPQTPPPTPTPRVEPVNIIPVSDRPFITLQPLPARNELEFIIHDLKIAAENVEVTLEYDRNKGILDAVLRQFTLNQTPFKENFFLGSKSAGGHVTYHDDVVGGTLHLDFFGDQPYALEVAWRYDDTQTSYDQFSTADGKFQVQLEKPLNTRKLVVMQSPGLPLPLSAPVIAGPYLFRGVGPLPQLNASLTLRLSQDTGSVRLWGYDGTNWIEIGSTLNGKTLTADTIIYQVYAVTE